MELILNKVDFNNICRICLSTKTEMFNIELLTSLIEFLQIELNKNNILPKSICQDCKDVMEKFVRFKEQCKQSEDILLKSINTDSIIKSEIEITAGCEQIKDEITINSDSYINNFSEDIFSYKSESLNEKFDNPSLNDNDNCSIDSDEINGEKCITCRICKKLIRQSTMKGHLRRHKQPRKHLCSICKKGYREPNELAKHRLKVHNIKESVSCHVCGEIYQIQAQLDFHMKRHFKKKSVCDICGKIYFNSAKLIRHKKSHEKRDKTIFCLLCDRMFAREDSLIVHNKKYHSGVPIQKKVCNICGKSVLNLKTHTLQKHSIERPFKCEKCDKSYVIRYQLLKHIKDQHNIKDKSDENLKKYNALCSTCGKCCKSIADLKTHMISHTDLQSYACSECDKKYKSAQGLRCHLRKHNDLRPYSCTQCSKAFYTSQILKNHLRTHTGERPYACQICGRAFTQNCSLKKHMKIHGL